MLYIIIILLIIVLSVLMIIVGFYFGFRYNQSSFESQESSSFQNSTQDSQGDSGSNLAIDAVDFKKIEEVFWIKLAQEPVCPQTHPIKGKFGSDVNVFYLPDHKSYNRVKPQICFKTKVFAEEEAGFLQKF